jgi:hypothetical protein
MRTTCFALARRVLITTWTNAVGKKAGVLDSTVLTTGCSNPMLMKFFAKSGIATLKRLKTAGVVLRPIAAMLTIVLWAMYPS